MQSKTVATKGVGTERNLLDSLFQKTVQNNKKKRGELFVWIYAQLCMYIIKMVHTTNQVFLLAHMYFFPLLSSCDMLLTNLAGTRFEKKSACNSTALGMREPILGQSEHVANRNKQ